MKLTYRCHQSSTPGMESVWSSWAIKRNQPRRDTPGYQSLSSDLLWQWSTYPAVRILTPWNWHEWLLSGWSASMAYQIILSPTPECSAPLNPGLEVAPKLASTTNSQPPSTHRPMASSIGRTRQWISASKPSATMSKITGPNSFPWRNSSKITHCMLR